MMAKILFICCLTAFFQLLVITSDGQANISNDVSGGTVYLHSDRSGYFAGESIFFKAYILNAISNHPETAGNNLYVAVIDQDGLEVAKGIFPVKNCQTEGKIELSDYLTEGNYVLIASTSLMRGVNPMNVFSKIIKVKRSEKREFYADVKLTDTIYKPGALLTAKVTFSEKGRKPVPASFSYQLTGSSGEVFAGKSKSGNDGTAIVTIQLPEFKYEESMKLFVTGSYKGDKKIMGIVIPTHFYNIYSKEDSGMNLPVYDKKQLNILIRTDKKQYRQNERVQVDILVADDKGAPVVASLSISAADVDYSSAPFQESSITSDSLMKNCDSENLQWRQIISGKKDTIPQILNTNGETGLQSESVFSTGLRNFFAGCLSTLTQSPGKQFVVQDKNDLKRLKTKKDTKATLKQEGYPPDQNIFDILRRIKPYYLVNDKIVFTSSGVTSLNNQDGALIVINGINSGTDSKILNTIPVADIARITASTNPMDIQRYTGMNSVGVIEIYTKKGRDTDITPVPAVGNKSSSLFWESGIITNSSGKAPISFLNDKSSPVIIISVAGITAGGMFGNSTIQLSVY